MCVFTTLSNLLKKTYYCRWYFSLLRLFMSSVSTVHLSSFNVFFLNSAYCSHFLNVFFIWFFSSKVCWLLRWWHSEEGPERRFFFWLQKNDCVSLPGQLCWKVRLRQTTQPSSFTLLCLFSLLSLSRDFKSTLFIILQQRWKSNAKPNADLVLPNRRR